MEKHDPQPSLNLEPSEFLDMDIELLEDIIAPGVIPLIDMGTQLSGILVGRTHIDIDSVDFANFPVENFDNPAFLNNVNAFNQSNEIFKLGFTSGVGSPSFDIATGLAFSQPASLHISDGTASVIIPSNESVNAMSFELLGLSSGDTVNVELFSPTGQFIPQSDDNGNIINGGIFAINPSTVSSIEYNANGLNGFVGIVSELTPIGEMDIKVSGGVAVDNVSAGSVPEPSTWVLALIGTISGLAAAGARRLWTRAREVVSSPMNSD
jgi:hypothetical protein